MIVEGNGTLDYVVGCRTHGVLDYVVDGYTLKVGRLLVERRHCGKGVGTSLMRRALDIARGEGCRWVRLDAVPIADHSSYSGMLRFYRRFGFKSTGPVTFGGCKVGEKMRLRLKRRVP